YTQGTPQITNFFPVWNTSVTVAYTGVSPTGGYLAQASTNSTFIAPVTSSVTAVNSTTTITIFSLSANTSYFFRVGAVFSGTTYYSGTASTATTIENVTNVAFDDISTFSITASAYAATPAFSNLDISTSGTNISFNGAYQGWHGDVWVTRAPRLTAR